MNHSSLIGLLEGGRLDVTARDLEVTAFLQFADVWPDLGTCGFWLGIHKNPYDFSQKNTEMAESQDSEDEFSLF